MAALFAFLLGAAAMACLATAEQGAPLYKQAGVPIPQRVSDLLSRMNLEEKVAQVAHRYGGMTVEQVKSKYAKTSLGQVSMQSLLVRATAADSLTARNDLQEYLMSNSRLGIPVSIAHEGLHSGAAFGTVFPESCLTSCSWNDTLATLIGQVLAAEARAYGVDNVWSPVVNMWTDDRFGRYQEGFSPDPTITSHFGRAMVLGVQGGVSGSDDYLPGGFNTSAWSTAKHFAGYGSAAGGLNGAPFVHNNRTLFEWFLRPWRAMSAIGLRGAMPSHNTVLDVPMHANRWLIQDVLRGEFGFANGCTVSDCNDIGALQYFGITDNSSCATAFGMRAGVDLDLQCNSEVEDETYFSHIPDAIDSGLATMADLDALVTHILTQKFAAGLFDQPQTPPEWLSRLDTAAHRQLAYEAAAQSIILLQNVNSTLPLNLGQGGKLDGGAMTIALVGPQLSCDPLAERGIKVVGDLGAAATGNAGSDCFARENMLGSYVLDRGNVSVPLIPEAFRRTFPHVNFLQASGCGIDEPGLDMIPAAVAAAQQSDYVVVAVGDSLQSCGEWLDRDSLDLPGGQMQLLQALVDQTTTPVIVVLINGRAVSFGPGNTLLGKLSAVIEAWRPGEEGAQAIVDIISGRVNPSGKLTNQWAQHVGQLASGAQPWLARRVGKWVANKRKPADADGRVYDSYVSSAFSSVPLFRFGHGLSYTEYAYKSIHVGVSLHLSDMVGKGVLSGRGRAGYLYGLDTQVLNVTVNVCNTGTVAGAEVVQVYSQDPVASSRLGVVPFWKRLVGYGRIYLQPSACGDIEIPVVADDLAQYDDFMTLLILPGRYLISAGGRSDLDILQANVTLG